MNIRQKKIVIVMIILVLFHLSGCKHSSEESRPVNLPTAGWPTSGWQVATPESQGVNSQDFLSLLDFLENNIDNLHSLLITRNGYLILDAYFYPYTQVPHDIASDTKSITSTLIGLAIENNYIGSVNENLLGFFPDRNILNLAGGKERITIEHLLTMCSGFGCGYLPGEVELFQMMTTDDWIQFVLDLPMAVEPGSQFSYCSGNHHLLSAIISQTYGNSTLDFAREYLFNPLGINEVIWPTDPQGINHGWGDLHLHPHDMAKIGYLYLNEGLWDNRRLLSQDWIRRAVQNQVSLSGAGDTGYGYSWWLFTGGPYEGVYAANGRGGQRIMVWPQKNVVIVVTGSTGYGPTDLLSRITPLFQNDEPLPANQEPYQALMNKLENITLAPPAETVPPLPQITTQISGQTYELDDNSIGFRTISLSFSDGSEAYFTITFLDYTHTGTIIESSGPIGLDNVYRLSSGRFDLPVGLKGVWESENEFILYMDEIANINMYRFHMTFREDQVIIHLQERTGLFDEIFNGWIR